MTLPTTLRIGVLAMQGAFAEHVAHLRRVTTVEVDAFEVRTVEQLDASRRASHFQLAAEWWRHPESNCSGGAVNELRETPTDVTPVSRVGRSTEASIDE